jgi:hypothetical protein
VELKRRKKLGDWLIWPEAGIDLLYSREECPMQTTLTVLQISRTCLVNRHISRQICIFDISGHSKYANVKRCPR